MTKINFGGVPAQPPDDGLPSGPQPTAKLVAQYLIASSSSTEVYTVRLFDDGIVTCHCHWAAHNTIAHLQLRPCRHILEAAKIHLAKEAQ